MKFIILSLAAVAALSALTIQEFELEVTEEETVSFEKKNVIYKRFNISPERLEEYTVIKEALINGDYISAKEKALRFFNKVNTINDGGGNERALGNILIGDVYLMEGEHYRWKYTHMSALNYFDRALEEKIIEESDWLFAMIEMPEILKETSESSEIFLKKIQDINSLFRENRSYYNERDRLYAEMKIHELFALGYEFRNMESRAIESLEKAGEICTKLYTYYSVEEARVLFKQAKLKGRLAYDSGEILNLYQEAFKVSKKILEKKELADTSVFLADIYFEIGNLLSQGSKQKDSIPYLDRAEKIYHAAGDTHKEIQTIFQKINSYKIMDRLEFSSIEVEKIKKIVAEKVEHGVKSSEYADALAAEADILNTMGKYSEAITIMKQVKAIYANIYGEYSKEVKMVNSSLVYMGLKSEDF